MDMSKSSPSSNSIVNTKQGVVLEQTGLLDKKHLSKLHALYITTVEELISMTQEAPQFMKSFLEGTDMSNLLNQASSIASINISDSELNMMKESPYTFGAIPPTVQLGHEVAQLFIDEEQVPPSGAP